MINAAIDYITTLFENNADGHDAAHSLRVYRIAMEILEKEDTCDREVVELAALLHVMPKFRRKGYAMELENAMIRKNMEAGFLPFGQVEKSNTASMALQKKLGLTQSENTIIWMWR